jgi:hypothetical protein
MRIERLRSTRTATGPLHCPRCAWLLGRLESPAIGYLTQCGGCKRALRVVDGAAGAIGIVVASEPSTEHGALVSLEEDRRWKDALAARPTAD